MSDLNDVLQDPERRDKVIDDCCKLVDDEVARKSGLGGVMIKTGYKMVRGIKPGFIRKVVSTLLPDWTAKLEPIWRENEAAPAEHLKANPGRVAEALLSVTDEKALRAKSGAVAKTYKKLRPSAKGHVEQAVPGLADVLARHTA